MAESLETVLADAGVEPALASGIMADGWTLRTFREIAATAADFTDALFAELCPHNDHLTLLQKHPSDRLGGTHNSQKPFKVPLQMAQCRSQPQGLQQMAHGQKFFHRS